MTRFFGAHLAVQAHVHVLHHELVAQVVVRPAVERGERGVVAGELRLESALQLRAHGGGPEDEGRGGGGGEDGEEVGEGVARLQEFEGVRCEERAHSGLNLHTRTPVTVSLLCPSCVPTLSSTAPRSERA